MFAHVPKDGLDMGVVDQRLRHHLDALTLGVWITCTDEINRIAYVCYAGGRVWM